MRALQLTKFYAPVRGGIESVTFELSEGLNKVGIATDVLCAHTAPTTIRETASAGYQITRAASFGKLLSTSMAPAMIRELGRAQKGYDVIHVHLPDPLSNLALLLTRPRARIVLHWHSDIINQPRALRVYAPLQRWLLQRADVIIATSQAYADASPWLAPHREKIRVIPIGIRDHPFDDGMALRVRASYPSRRIVFSLGRMSYYKGFDTLIDAAAQLPPDCVVLVGGGGELLDTHRRTVAKRKLTERIVFLGPLDDSQVLAHLRAGDVFCLPSIVRAEAFGVVLLEAMAAERPIVTTDIPGSGVPWVCPDGLTGLNAPVGDSVALARALTTLLDNKSLSQRLGAAARERFMQHFTAERMVRATADLYRDICLFGSGT